MHKLGITDASFLYMESPSNPMNIGSVQLLDVPQRDGFFNELKLYLADRVRAIPFMCRRSEVDAVHARSTRVGR